MTRQVLVVDDDDDIRNTVVEILEGEGFLVTSAENGRAALDLLNGGARPHLILLDMMMPEMDGRTFLGAIPREGELASIPVVLFSAYGRPQDLDYPIAGFLRKPLRLKDLVDAVESFIARAEGLQSTV